MKTYLTIWFSSDGAKTSEVTQRLLSMGFRPIRGNYDYEYDWGTRATVEDIIRLADQVHATLQGCKVAFKLETI